MSLENGSSQEVISRNIAELIKAGHSPEQAAAIVYKEAGISTAQDSARVQDINGWSEIKGNPLSMVGVFPYLGSSIGAPDPDRMYYVYRPAEELATPECLESFKLLPWVDDHPQVILGDENAGLIPAERKSVHGVIGEDVFFDGQYLRGNIKVWSSALANLIDSGKKELSVGYRCVYNFCQGTFEGQNYDAVQRQIRGNHLALVSAGRCGSEVAVMDSMTDHYIFTVDAKDFIMADQNQPEVNKEEGGAGGELTLTEIAQKLKELEPMVAAIGEIQSYLAKLKPLEAAEHPELKTETETDAKPEGDAAGAELAEKKPTGMDAAAVDALVAQRLVEIGQRDKLAGRVSQVIGSFDHSEMSLAQCAKYAADKLGLSCAAGHEVTAVDAFLAGRSAATVKTAQDAAPKTGGAVDKYLQGA